MARQLESHVWITDEFSVRREDLCWRQKGSSNAFCTLGLRHAGPCKHTWNPDVRLYSAQEGRRA